MPMEMNQKLQNDDEPIVDKTSYQRLLGNLAYLTATRRDITYAVNKLSQVLIQESHILWQYIEFLNTYTKYRVLKYLHKIPGKGLTFRISDRLKIERYLDLDWAENINDKKSTSGCCCSVGMNLIIWSSVEAEYTSMTLNICEMCWLKHWI